MNPSIAIIDSGVNSGHIHVGNVSGGLGYCLSADGEVVKTDDFGDEIGHGTAIAGIIHRENPSAELYAIKIFKERLSTSISVLLKALSWAVENRFRIIHLSLCVEEESIGGGLQALCRKAHDNNQLILASAKGPDDRTYPASFDTVVGVYWNSSCSGKETVYHPGSRIEFGAHGWPRPLPGMPQERNFRGSSFAVAHVTAKAARLVKEFPDKDNSWIRDQLAYDSKIIRRAS